MTQYYILSRERSGKLRRWIWPAENTSQLIDGFKNTQYTAGQEIINFDIYIPGKPEPDWYKLKEPEEQLELF